MAINDQSVLFNECLNLESDRLRPKFKFTEFNKGIKISFNQGSFTELTENHKFNLRVFRLFREVFEYAKVALIIVNEKMYVEVEEDYLTDTYCKMIHKAEKAAQDSTLINYEEYKPIENVFSNFSMAFGKLCIKSQIKGKYELTAKPYEYIDVESLIAGYAYFADKEVKK